MVFRRNYLDENESIESQLRQFESAARHGPLLGIVEDPIAVFILDGEPDYLAVALNASDMPTAGWFYGRACRHQERLPGGRWRSLLASN